MIIPLEREYPSRWGLPIVDKVDTLIFSTLYPKAGCAGCASACCSGGATMDLLAFERLRPHRGDPAFSRIVWDGYDFTDDPDSPGGKGCYTRFDGGRCMFQEPGGGCAIHSYCLRRGLEVRELKFFTCCLFPVEVNKVGGARRVLTAGYELRHPQFDLPCKKGGDTAAYDIARPDIGYYYGEDLLREIDALRSAAREG